MVQCEGLYHCNFEAALSFAVKAMLNTGHKLLEWAAEKDAGMKRFASSALATTNKLLLPFYGLIIHRAQETSHSFYFSSVGCRVLNVLGNNDMKARRCDVCAEAKKVGKKNIQRHCNPHATLADRNTRIDYITNDPVKSKLEIEHQRATVKILR